MIYDDEPANFERPPQDGPAWTPAPEPEAESDNPRTLRELWRSLDQTGRVRAFALLCFVLGVVAFVVGIIVAVT